MPDSKPGASSDDDTRREFIGDKYLLKKYAKPDSKPPTGTSVA